MTDKPMIRADLVERLRAESDVCQANGVRPMSVRLLREAADRLEQQSRPDRHTLLIDVVGLIGSHMIVTDRRIGDPSGALYGFEIDYEAAARAITDHILGEAG